MYSWILQTTAVDWKQWQSKPYIKCGIRTEDILYMCNICLHIFTNISQNFALLAHLHHTMSPPNHQEPAFIPQQKTNDLRNFETPHLIGNSRKSIYQLLILQFAAHSEFQDSWAIPTPCTDCLLITSWLVPPLFSLKDIVFTILSNSNMAVFNFI